MKAILHQALDKAEKFGVSQNYMRELREEIESVKLEKLIVSNGANMMNAKELSANIGKQGLLSIDNMRVLVNITDARQVFGRIDYQVSPANGTGSNWVESSRVAKVGA